MTVKNKLSWTEGRARWRWLCPACGVVRPVKEHKTQCELERQMRKRPSFY